MILYYLLILVLISIYVRVSRVYIVLGLRFSRILQVLEIIILYYLDRIFESSLKISKGDSRYS